ncbi:NAD(P)H-binding protein [Candidatus Saccharibacteria bacterium]|nr:NAD(P)H-binding protein [Candidatus Saccharibacteria bacterium]
MRVVIFGANGRVGRLVVRRALEQGLGVVAFVHSASSLAQNSKLTVVQGDIYRPDEVAAAIRQADAVISALGSWGTPRKDVLGAGMQAIIPAMQEHGLSRIVSLTGADARAPGDTLGIVHRLSHPLLGLVAGKVLADGEQHIRLLQASGLAWTVVRSPVMNEQGDAGRFVLSRRRPMPWQTIHRQSVATSMVELVQSQAELRAAPFIARN